jgi:putative addiction module component (TIGR02574 family)
VSLSASEFYEAGMALPPGVRRDVALRLLESLEIADQELVDEAWSREIGSRVDDIVAGNVQTMPGEQVFADIAARRSTRHA